MPKSKIKIKNFSLWLADKRSAVLNNVRDTLISSATNTKQREYYLLALKLYQKKVKENKLDMSIHIDLPILVYASTGSFNALNAVKLATITTLMEIGIRLLDDIIDHDFLPFWRNIHPEIIRLAAYDMYTTLPCLLINKLSLDKKTKENMVTTIFEYYLKISSGEQDDIANRDITIKKAQDPFNIIINKNGMWRALYAALAICMGEGTVSAKNPLVVFALDLGLIRQINNDIYDLMHSERSSDLASGLRTFPILLYLNRLKPPEKRKFVSLLNDAKHSTAAQNKVKDILRSKKVVTTLLLLLDVYRSKTDDVLGKLKLPKQIYQCLLKFLE